MSNDLRIFFAHSKDDPDDWIDTTCTAIRLVMARTFPGSIAVVSGRDDFRSVVGNAPKGKAGAGSWRDWMNLVVHGQWADGQPRYHGFVVPALNVGKATASIVEGALMLPKPVLYFDGVRFQDVQGVVSPEDPKGSWKSGWKLLVG